MSRHFDPLALIKEILVFIGISVLAFGWMMLMLLIISFVALSYVKITLAVMLWVSAGFTVIADIYTAVRRYAPKK